MYNIDNVSAQLIPELSGQHELHFTAPSRALNLLTTPSLDLPELAEEWLQLLHTGSLPPQALCQTAPAPTTGVQSSSPTHQNGQGKVRPSAHEVEAEQHCRNTRRYTIPGQRGNTNVWNMTNTPESQTSVSEVINNAVKCISFPAPAPFYVELPSPQPTEQTSQHETSPPKTPLPAATLHSTPNSLRRSTRVNTIATKSSHHQLGPEKPAPQKKALRRNQRGRRRHEDSSGARTAKRLRAVHNSTPAGRAAQPLDKSPGANQQELARPQSRLDSTPRGDNRKVHGRGRLQDPRTRPARPIDIEASRGIPTDDCSACGFHAEHPFQPTEMARRWIPKDDASFEALFESNFGVSDTDNSAIMLRLCLGSIRDYAREMATVRRQPGHPLQPTMTPPHRDRKDKRYHVGPK